MRPWETVSRQVILNHSKYLTVESHDIRLPNGDMITNWPWIITPDFVIVVVVTKSGEFILFRQPKYSIEGVGLAPVGGYLDPDEKPLTAAIRELHEEIGYTSDLWVHLGSYPVDGNRGVGTAHLYLAADVEESLADGIISESDDLEEQEIIILTKAEVKQAMMANEFKVLPWVTAISLALHYLNS